ncbi:MAG: hypothetical protein KF763_03255 [Cyclobacteriaceae bacterium]|nr:hypothetical protein [Cyclobacteriaceae bacterium]
MDKVSIVPVKILLSDWRGCSQSPVHQSKHCLPEPFGLLNYFDEVVLKPGCMMKQKIQQTGIFFLLPVVGACKVSHGNIHTIDVGDLYITHVKKDDEVQIRNPYVGEWIRFIVWEINGDATEATAFPGFDLNLNLGKLVRIFKGSANDQRIAIRAGMFEGRGEGSLSLPNANHFIFVLEGVFEVQHRLLHTHDALSIPDCTHLEFEALSNKAILLVLSQF